MIAQIQIPFDLVINEGCKYEFSAVRLSEKDVINK
jgi:hypothetical protein